MSFDNLEAIFKGAGDYNSGLSTGQGLAFDEAKTRAEQQKLMDLQQAYQHNATMNPMKAEHQSLQNQGLQEGLGGITADTTSKQIKARVAGATEDGDVATALSTNDLTQMGNRLKTLDNVRQQATRLVAGIGNDEGRKQQVLRSGVIPQGEMYDLIARTPASQLRDKLENLNKYVSSQTDAFVQAQAQSQSHERVGAANNRTQLKIAEMNNDTRRELAEAKAEADRHKAESKLANAKLEAKNVEASILAIPIALRTPEQQAQLEEASSILNLRSGAAMGLNLESINPNFKSNASAGKAGGRKPLGDY